MDRGGIMKVSLLRIFNKSKKAMSSKEFGIDFLLTSRIFLPFFAL